MTQTPKRSGERIRLRFAELVERAQRTPAEFPSSGEIAPHRGVAPPAAARGRAPEREEPCADSRRGRGPQKAPTKVQISIRLDPDVLDALKSEGRGWQSRLNETLRGVLSLDQSAPAE